MTPSITPHTNIHGETNTNIHGGAQRGLGYSIRLTENQLNSPNSPNNPVSPDGLWGYPGVSIQQVHLQYKKNVYNNPNDPSNPKWNKVYKQIVHFLPEELTSEVI